MGKSSREPIESMRDALDLIEDLENKLEATQKILSDLVVDSFRASCRCGDWQFMEEYQKTELLNRIKALEEEDE